MRLDRWWDAHQTNLWRLMQKAHQKADLRKFQCLILVSKKKKKPWKYVYFLLFSTNGALHSVRHMELWATSLLSQLLFLTVCFVISLERHFCRDGNNLKCVYIIHSMITKTNAVIVLHTPNYGIVDASFCICISFWIRLHATCMWRAIKWRLLTVCPVLSNFIRSENPVT